MNVINGLWPGEVASYDGVRRICRVRVVGITDGSGELPEAVFNNPLGDRAPDTEIRILPNDPVWLMFEGGDPRFPIIMGYRTPRDGNPVDWRRWRHANIELQADGMMKLISGAAMLLQVGSTFSLSAAASITMTAPAISLSGSVSIDGPLEVSGDTGFAGNLGVGGTLLNAGVNVGSTHVHGGVQSGGSSTSGPS